MITLDRKGHWYRFFNRCGVCPINLCTVFWAAITLPPMWTVIGVVASLAIIYSLLGWFHVFALFFGVPWPFGADSVTTIWVALLLMFETVALVIWGVVSLLEAMGNAAAVTSAGGMAKEAYRGFKDKYCPLVEWK